MDYRIEEKPEMILTGYKKRFMGAPDERFEQECDFYVHTRAKQYMLNGMSEHYETMHDVITNIDGEGYDFYITQELSEYTREHINDVEILGKEYSKLFENIVIPGHTYAVFETERCQYPTMIFLDLRKRIISEWLPSSGYRISDAPEIVVTHWFKKPNNKQRYRELWIPIEKI